MRRPIARILAVSACTTQLLVCLMVPMGPMDNAAARAQDARARRYTTWRDYGGTADSMQYSALAQINRDTVKQLAPAWFYPVPGDASRLPFNPLVIDDLMYVAGPKNAVVALDAASGKEIWTSTERATERGLTYLSLIHI